MSITSNNGLIKRQWLIVLCDRNHANLSQQRLADKIAEKCGYRFNRTCINHWMNGRRNIYADVIYMLAEVLGQSCDDLCRWEYEYRVARERMRAIADTEVAAVKEGGVFT